ncbi:MAG TPA: hydantoinase B/oxoprolinase family protein [Gammaproteobacteria bacterium]|nr:hydantoinase B/oxoprolinase family protein [Gammaproteobacteria bacterium]
MSEPAALSEDFDPVLLAVLSNRMDAIVREMTNTLLRAARSAVIAMSRDFSCCLVTGDGRLLASAEAAPVHVFGTHLQAQAMSELHRDLREGDAFLHNDPYLGNTHPADHTILVPVFCAGEHLFTAVAKAHQADIGNSIPTTYHAAARDVYEEGALIFPCVRVQREYRNVEDIIRMCRRRIRVPDQWYGDFLAAIGAARIGERRLQALAAQYGVPMLKDFVAAWFDYSERRIVQEIRRLPAARLENTTRHDPIPGVIPDGIALKVVLEIDPVAARIDVDLRDNPDCLPCGLNESMACAINNAMTGVLNCLDPDIPHNAGSFRRLRVHLRENCVVGIPRFPHSCSVATTNVGDRLVNATQSAFAGIGDGWGLAEGNTALSSGCAVVSGRDARHGERDYINQMFLMGGGGPASPSSDGWINLLIPVGAGLLYRDSVELDEQKYPILVRSLRLMRDSGGAGRYRGAPGTEVVYGPRQRAMRVVSAPDGWCTPPRGVHGGGDGTPGADHVLHADGRETKIEGFIDVELVPGEYIRGRDCGGGGYGDPLEREVARVLHDLRERWISRPQAEAIYGVVFREEDGVLAVDEAATQEARKRLAAARD